MGNLPNQSVAEQVSVGDAYENAHMVEKGDPKIDGPYLDDIRAAQEDEYRRQRQKSISQIRDEDTEKKRDVPFKDFRAKSQQQHDENRYYEEGSVEESVKAAVKKIPQTPVELAGTEDRALPGTDSKRRAVQKADKFKGKSEGNTPDIDVEQKKASLVSDRVGQPSNDTKGATEAMPSKQPEVSLDPKAVAQEKRDQKKETLKVDKTVVKKTAAKKAATTRPDAKTQSSVAEKENL